ncbi:MAG: hypothetical protein ACK5Y7_00425 [Betaproteobacteria bacterium]|jgi:hypothetical protein|nr:hypothetical protein [Rubrivivax sp.]
MSATLSHELSVYERQLPSLLKEHEGEYVIIKGDDLAHFSPDYESALSWAYEHIGLAGFFVRRVAPDGGTLHMTREIGPCR